MPDSRVVSPDHAQWALLFAGVLAIKLVLLAVDPTVRLFMGDSASYLHYAIDNSPAPDRSFTYSVLIQGTALATSSLFSLLAVQTLLGVLSCALVFGLLRSVFDVRFPLAFSAALLLALEPAQLFYERMVMAESAGTACLIVMVGCGLMHIRTGHWRWLLYAAIAGVGTVSFRLSLLPVVLGAAALPPLIAAIAGTRVASARAHWLRALVMTAVALTATGLAHGGYKHWYNELSTTEDRVDYIDSSGAMRVGLVAPLIQPRHLHDLGLPADMLDELGVPLRDPRAREAQMWLDNGLVALVRKYSDDPERALRKIAMRALRDDPFALVGLGLSTLADYFEPGITGPRLYDDLGRRPPDEGLLRVMRERFHYDAARIAASETFASRWFALGAPWLTFCLFGLPLLAIGAVVVTWRGARAPVLYISLIALGAFLAQALFSHIASFRYLHPLPALVLMLAAIIAEALMSRRSQRR